MPFFALCSICRFLSTPSGWRATGQQWVCDEVDLGFLSTPSGWRATCRIRAGRTSGRYFYPRPPGGGRRPAEVFLMLICYFYPRPPGGGRLVSGVYPQRLFEISIHALRVEGDCCREYGIYVSGISIHALRVEGDRCPKVPAHLCAAFLSTPSGWRATHTVALDTTLTHISIHALRVEGDTISAPADTISVIISIHALRVEGDTCSTPPTKRSLNFYPRPPGGGRQVGGRLPPGRISFLSTPSGWRATLHRMSSSGGSTNFYPRPPGGGRRRRPATPASSCPYFYPRPPGGGRPSKSSGFWRTA